MTERLPEGSLGQAGSSLWIHADSQVLLKQIQYGVPCYESTLATRDATFYLA